ncbi:NB-ARC domain-containing protein [Yersinia enterocolitica]|uniref:ATP-binding protein n=1 Tax=Yersinia enterocolitica TaxID=630 RepID=UPI0021E96122|nr:ATP-binding protein [Yersinia enterocolitica]UYK09262.1 ATP-binding protein [Yersinia enterocolitica]HDL7972765.1 ATP-binding protein [Yersinia enterocolitica]
MDEYLGRRKTAMVLHELELALGNYILNTEVTIDNFPDEVIRNVVKRETERNSTIDFKNPKNIIESTYLDEMFNIVLEITKDTSVFSYLTRLKELFVLFGVYEIRNVVSHPNRKFIETYWYRIAAIASDPIIDVLGMESVKKAIISAENGELVDPPEEWINKIIWEIPNNLPDSFEHAITGLVGRKKEEEELLKQLQNLRVNTIAVVAQGGIGKTSLVLELLSNKVKSPETKQYFDCCIFSTLKTERLTYEGIEKLDAIESIDELKKVIFNEANHIYDEVFSDFDDLCEKKSKERVLLFIDNLETLLIESEKAFQDFNLALPSSWRVLVTSRVSINNASIISLEPLKEKSAIHLARVYLSRKNHNPLIDTILTDMVRKCYCNPLAIRLTIDLHAFGKEIPDSISVANKEITSFSFSNLIDSLSLSSIGILEALFIANELNRTTLCEILSISIEELSEGVSQLSNTSLIVRTVSDNGEKYSLSDSIRELLLTNPRNILLRDKIQEDMKRRKAISKRIEQDQIRNSIPVYHWDYIPSNINENLKILLTECNKSFKGMTISSGRAIELMKKFKDVEHLYNDVSIFNRNYARLLSALNASSLAEQKYNSAISQDIDDVNAKIFYAMHLHNIGSYSESNSIYLNLIELGWIDEEKYSSDLVNRITNGFYFSLLYNDEYENILEYSKDWKKLKSSRGSVGVFRATAIKRLAEGLVSTDTEKAISLLTRAMRTLDDVIRNDGYIKPACDQTKNLFNDLATSLRYDACSSNSKYTKEVLDFIVTHVNNVNGFSDDDEILGLIKKLASLKVENNPFSRMDVKKFTKEKYFETLDSEDIISKGLIVVNVTNIPKKKEKHSPYIFASFGGEDYFLHFDALKNGDFNMWTRISVGSLLAVKPNEIALSKVGKARDVVEVHFID